MSKNGLYDPLGTDRTGHSARRRRPSALIVVGAVLLLGVGVVGFEVRRFPGDRGDPIATAAIDRPPAPETSPKPAAQLPPVQTEPKEAEAMAGPPTESVEIQNGVRIVRPIPGASSPGQRVLKVPEEARPGLAEAPDPRIAEPSPFGLLPKIGAGGVRPATVYARPAELDTPPSGRPRIALLVGGMGLDRQATESASSALPAAVTFGFAPYGADLDGQVTRTRNAGHEVVLQLPMEDFAAKPGLSHMLLAEGAGNEDRLRWLLGRFVGYAGVSNYLGGRFLADETALGPILRELSARGLFFVDDGTASRSLALAVAADVDLPAVRATVVLDAKSDPAAIDEAWAQLEALARERGTVVGMCTGLPLTVATVSRLAKAAAGRGFAIVPVSAIANGVRTANAASSARSRSGP